MLNLNSCIYLDNAATSRYKPKKVIKAVEKELKRSANAGRGGHKESLRALTKIEEARDEVCTIVGDKNVVFTKSCTEALNLAIFGSYKSGEIITSVYEHNSVLRPVERLKARGARVNYIQTKNDIITPSDLKARISKNTSLVVLQEMSNVTGTIQPIEDLGKLCAEYGIPFCVDCAQSLGHLKTDYSNVDFVCAPAHKGLHAMQGTGFLAFKMGLDLTPLLCGGTGTESASLLQPNTPPEGYEAGTLNTPGICGLREGILFTMRHFSAIHKNVRNLSILLTEELKKLPSVKLYSPSPNGVISFNIGDIPSTDIADLLDSRYDICVRPGLHCAPLIHKRLGTLRQGAVRVSIGYNNTQSDIERLLEAVKDLAKYK